MRQLQVIITALSPPSWMPVQPKDRITILEGKQTGPTVLEARLVDAVNQEASQTPLNFGHDSGVTKTPGIIMIRSMRSTTETTCARNSPKGKEPLTTYPS